MLDRELRKKLGDKARELRKAAKMTQREVAEKLGIHQADLSAFESRGDKIGSPEKINDLFNFFGYELTVAEKKTCVDITVAEQDLHELYGLLENGDTTDVQTKYQRLKQKLTQMLPELKDNPETPEDSSSQDS